MTIKRLGYLLLGWTCIGLAVLGVVLPLLPTTPFVLVAAFAFSKSSKRFHHWLLTHKIFGPLVVDWQKSGVIRMRAKLLATVSMVVMLTLSFVVLDASLRLILAVSLMVSCVLAFIWSRPSKPIEES